MASQITNYQCPACTGPLHFVGSSGKLECDYCGSTFEVAEIEKLYAQKDASAAAAAAAAEKQAFSGTADEDWNEAAAGSDWGAEADGMKAYNCPSCGAELICDETTAATSCPYCGNPTIVPGQFAGSKKPDYIIPFKLDKEAAIAALKKHYAKKPFLPKEFTAQNHINEIQGVYVPFWLFDGSGDVNVTFEATRSHTHETRDERITETEHYMVQRDGTVQFQRVPVDASTKMPDENMDAIEPFNYEELTGFSNAYLPGYLADQYDVSIQESAKRADTRCQESCIQAMQDTVQGYETCTVTSSNVSLHRGDVKYVLLPVWMLHTSWHGKDYLFSMNGQTGKLIGDLPMSWKKFWTWFGCITAGVGVLLCLLQCIL